MNKYLAVILFSMVIVGCDYYDSDSTLPFIYYVDLERRVGARDDELFARIEARDNDLDMKIIRWTASTKSCFENGCDRISGSINLPDQTTEYMIYQFMLIAEADKSWIFEFRIEDSAKNKSNIYTEEFYEN